MEQVNRRHHQKLNLKNVNFGGVYDRIGHKIYEIKYHRIKTKNNEIATYCQILINKKSF